ncbi:MAG TPA: DEAD/DEAH box helicase [Candidatus Obscuribacterales bacterium]
MISPNLDLSKLYPFPLDDFQTQAIAALDDGKSVVVCAPTGSGKTLIGEYAIHRALASNRRVFYTTPLKALSNQKLRDFRDRFGADNVGLLTGDVSINRHAPVLVMTTEIFRNMLYGTAIGAVGTSLVDVQAVVLDECHYMNDRQRGTVWEESIIYCPPEIQLVALSATVDNSDQLTDWICQVHGPTELIYSDFRPVPLEFNFCKPNGLFPLLNSTNTKINPRLKPKGGKKRSRQDSPALGYVISQLSQRDMLPAIYFIFSRKGCDRAVEEVSQMSLVTEQEQAQLKRYIDEFLNHNPDAARVGQVEPLYQGIAAHHAGILPAWKSLVEELFQMGLIKVVFATETLAAGINMPARTTVISSLSKRTDRGHRLLNASEFLQMAGRAGRRGMDERGYVVTVQTRFEGAQEASYLATSRADPLISQFTPSYGMVLNLLQTHSLEEAQELIERSFGQYLATLHLQPQQQAIADIEALIAKHQADLDHVDVDALAHYQKLNERLKEERRLLKVLKQQAQQVQAQDLALSVNFAIAGTILSLRQPEMTAVLVMKLPREGQDPFLVCLGQDNLLRVVTLADVAQLHAELPRLSEVDTWAPPRGIQPRPGYTCKGDEDTLAIARRLPQVELPQSFTPEVKEYLERVADIEDQIAHHPARQWGNPGQMIKHQKRITKLQADLSDRLNKLEAHTHRYWQEFVNLMRILQHFQCLEGSEPAPIGQIAAAIRGDNELWLGLALASGELDALDPHQLAATCAALVTEVSRPDIWTRYDHSDAVEQALAGLRGLRRQLFQQQRRYQVALPVWLEQEWIALVEQWAMGEDWTDLCSNTSLDEGDLVRILRRTVDFLSQIPYVPYLSGDLRQNAQLAIRAIDRFPVNEADLTDILGDMDEPETEEESEEPEKKPDVPLLTLDEETGKKP